MDSKYNIYTHDDLKVGVEYISKNIIQDDWKPDLIVGVLRGGAIPAVYFSHYLGIEMMTVEWSTRDGAVGQILEGKFLDELRSGKRILLVDDICDSGLTLKQIMDKIRLLETVHDKPINCRIATLHYNEAHAMIEPDYYHLCINKHDDPRWIKYPWEME